MKTRYGANPPHQNTFTTIQAPKNAATYISEKERFNIHGESNVERERAKNMSMKENKWKKLKSYQDNIRETISHKELMEKEKDIFSQLQRTKKLFNYEQVLIIYLCYIIIIIIILLDKFGEKYFSGVKLFKRIRVKINKICFIYQIIINKNKNENK